MCEEAVKEIVMSKYEYKFKRQLNKSLERRQKRSLDGSWKSLKSTGSSVRSSCGEDEHNNYPEKDIQKRYLAEFQKTSSAAYQSINTSCISTLISTETCQRTLMQDSVFDTSTISSYEYISQHYDKNNYFLIQKTEMLFNEITVQDEIILQVSKALHYGKKKRKFNFSLQHIEAEKILLVASFRKELLLKELRNEYSEISQLKVGVVTLNNLKFTPKFPRTTKIDKRYYVCLINSGTKLLASKVMEEDITGAISFDDCFTFSGLCSNFEIAFYLFALKVSSKTKKDKCPLTYKEDYIPIRPSLFDFCGQCSINKFQLQNTIVPFRNTLTGVPFSSLHLNINYGMNIKETYLFSGFLNISKLSTNLCPLWSLRWVLLEGGELKYWNYPQEQGMYEPIKVIDLNLCTNFGIANREICPKPKTLFLEIKHNEIYLLSTRTDEEFRDWEKAIRLVLLAITNWKQA